MSIIGFFGMNLGSTEHMIDLPGRPDFWNIGYPLFGAIVYLAVPISLRGISYGIIRRVKLWKIGLGKSEMLHLDKRIYRFVRELMFGVVTHKNFIRKKIFFSKKN